MIDKISALQCN